MNTKKGALFLALLCIFTTNIHAIILDLHLDIKEKCSPNNQFILSSTRPASFDEVSNVCLMNGESHGFSIDITPSRNPEDDGDIDFQCSIQELQDGASQAICRPVIRGSLEEELVYSLGDNSREITFSLLSREDIH